MKKNRLMIHLAPVLIAAVLAAGGTGAAVSVCADDEGYSSDEYSSDGYSSDENGAESSSEPGQGDTGESSAEEIPEDTTGLTPDQPQVFKYETDVNPDYYNGTWVDTGAGLKVWLPEYWEKKELSEDAQKMGLIFKYGESGGMNITITASEIPKAARPYELTDFYDELQAHYQNVYYADINGLPCILFEDEENALSGFAYLTEDKTIVGIVTPPSKYEWKDYGYFIRNILYSVSAS
jgi:hypothetical protein